MSPAHLVSYTAHTPVAWANGAGTTVELVSREASTALTPDLPPWRLSIATLLHPAAFSPLPGMQRQFMPVGGNVVLTIDGKPVAVSEGTVCAFDGGATVDLVELTGECNAVNLMIATDPATHTPTAPLTLSRVTAHQHAPSNTLFALPLTHTNGANQFDLIRPITHTNAAYTAACTGPWAAIAKSGCHSSASPLTAS